MGKSNLISYCHKYLRDNLVESCIIRGNEVEQSSPYCILQIILSKLLPFILDDDDESPMSNRPSAGATKSFMTLSPDNGISRVLEKCGEIPAYASLIARLAAGGSISDVDNNPLSKMLRDGFKPTTSKFIAYILREYRIALLLDDVQWFDRISLDVLYEITKISTNILLVVFSRPVDASHAINSIAFDVRLQLSGLRHEEVQAFLLKAFGITINNPQLIDSIIEKTNGNLLQVDTLASYLADKYPGGNARIGDYKFSQSLDNLFSTKIETIILAKFDSLHPRLQTILRLASLFGQYFSVGDVLFLFCDESDEQVTSKSLIVDMRQFDKHDFLKIETDPKGGFSDDDPNIFFRHITIKNAIYDNISLVERQAMHQKIAQRYEDHVRLHPDERKSKMPTIYHHYWKSGMHGKIIHIGFELGCAFCADGHYYDATKYFLDITEMEQNASEDMKYGKEVLMSRKMKAEALAKLAWSSTSILPPSKVKHFAIDALALYGVTWPVDRKGATKAVVRSIFKVFNFGFGQEADWLKGRLRLSRIWNL
ncbi:hypothetical protein BC829DRAFT_262141 [Chytridium lagenaria]|nr:hypothetical protein BC829DRAFT_262141 [Chytridium lagenaria]